VSFAAWSCHPFINIYSIQTRARLFAPAMDALFFFADKPGRITSGFRGAFAPYPISKWPTYNGSR
jgi:hypothetical protein